MITGADILLTHVHAAVSDTVQAGIRPDAGAPTWYRSARDAVAFASGRALAGQTTLLWLDTWSLEGVADQLRAARERSLPLVVVVTSPVGRYGHTAGILDAGCPVLTPATAQELLDLSVAAQVMAGRLSAPVLVVADGRTTVWTTESVVDPFDAVPSGADSRLGWADTSHPVGLGLPVPPVLRLKQHVGRFATRSHELRAVLDDAFGQVAAATGRPLPVLRAPTTPPLVDDVAFIGAGTQASTAWSLSCVHPFPQGAIQDALGATRVIGVLDDGLDVEPGDHALIHQVRSALMPLPTASGSKRPWLRSSPDVERAIVPVLLPAHDIPGDTRLQAAARVLSGSQDPGPHVVGASLTAPDIRIPEVEWTVQRMKADGLDLSRYETPGAGPDVPFLLVVGRTARDAWQDMEEIVQRLGADTYSGRFHATTDGASSPVLGRVDGPFERFTAWTRNADMLDTPEARAAMAPGTVLLMPEAPDVWPDWMAGAGLSWAVGPLDTVLSDPTTNPVPAPATPPAPETAPPPEIADRDDETLDRYWRMWGHLYRSGRLLHGPVDAALLDGSAPASTGSMLTHATRPGRLPHLIPERCTACAACWTVCPEAAIVARRFRFEEVLSAAQPAGALHLPRLKAAIAKQADRLVRKDGLFQWLTVGDALLEAARQVAEKAGMDEPAAAALGAEMNQVATSVGAVRLARAESEPSGDAWTGLAVDPDACTACGVCIQTCPEQALERTDAWDAVAAWRAAAQLPPTADEASRTTRLIGTSSGRMARSGSADRGNLNRTALRLMLESAHERARDRYAALRLQLQDLIDSLEPAMRTILADTADLNVFERSTRTLTVDSRGAERLEALREVRDSLATLTFEDRPHVLLLDATRNRSLGLAGWPVNPFSMPYASCSADDVPGLVQGLRDGLRARFTDVARQIRTAGQLRDDVLDDPNTTDADREAAEALLPEIVVVADVPVQAGPGTRVLILTGAGPDEPVPTHGLHDPVALLETFDASGPAPITVYAPDPVRDGFDTEDAVSVARLALRAGVVPGRSEAPDVSAADWMVLQERFAHHFSPVARRDWHPDQVAVMEWLSTPDNRQPYVLRGADRFLLDPVAQSFARSVWDRQRVPARAEKPIPETATTEQSGPVPAATHDAFDALETLQANLLRLARIDTLEDAP